MSKHVVITGAAGFLGRAVLNASLADPDVGHVFACDIVPLNMSHPKLTVATCNLTAPVLRRAIGDADAVIHLAATLGGAAERDPQAARKINLDATLELISACAPSTRFVFASSLAVLGPTANQLAPTSVYGTFKVMAEVALEKSTQRGEIDGISLRPGGIVARAGNDTGLKTAFLSQVFWAIRDGRDITLPVSEDGETALSSVSNVAANFIYGAMAPNLGPVRSLTLPMTTVRFGALVEGLRETFPLSRSKVIYAPDPDIMAQFARSEPPDMQNGLNAGFVPDKNLEALINDALKHGESNEVCNPSQRSA